MNQYIALVTTILVAFSSDLFAAPACIDAASDTDGDGWGWENSRSCMVATSQCIDSDGDGFGWNGSATCLVGTEASEATITDCVDSDGDGYGWNGTDTCLVFSDEVESQEDQPLAIDSVSIVDDGLYCAVEFCSFDASSLGLRMGRGIFSFAIGRDQCSVTEIRYSVFAANGTSVVADRTELINPGRLRHEVSFPVMGQDNFLLNIKAINSCGCLSSSEHNI